MTVTLRLVDSSPHGGLLYLHLKNAGLVIVSRDLISQEIDVDGDPEAVQRAIDGWRGEGRIEAVESPTSNAGRYRALPLR